MPGVDFPSSKTPEVRKVKIVKYNSICYEIGTEEINILRVIDSRSNPDTTIY